MVIVTIVADDLVPLPGVRLADPAACAGPDALDARAEVHVIAIVRSAALAALAAFALGTAAPTAAAQTLTSVERRLVAAAEAQVPGAIALLETLVEINSGTMNLEGVRRAGEVMRRELEPLGFAVRWVPMDEVQRAGHLVAEHAGTGRGKRMLLIGHLDTVFEKDSPFQEFVRKGDIAEGPGANDMKDGLAIMIAALRAMEKADTLKPAHITIVLSGDEERVGRPIAVARRDMREAARRSDVALEFESLAQEDGRDMGSVARRSSSGWDVAVTAKSGHSSGVFSDDPGFGAAYEMARILDAFRRELREPDATFNVGLLASGATATIDEAEAHGAITGKTNIVPATALARGDLRTLSNEQTERIRRRMREIVAGSLSGAKAEISFEDRYPAMPPTQGNRALLGKLNEVNAKLGLPEMGELPPIERGAGDIAFVADLLDGLIGFGAVGKGSHAPGETVDLSSFERQIERAALFMTALAQ
ncbi:MAG: M20/M25/M40 family metallo-hydrolase [Steroidobacteraceae bacterium]